MTREWEHLIEAAQSVSRNAYAPHSKLRIGAALEGAQGIHTGCNVENSSFGLTICAERAAICCALAAGDREFRRLVIYTEDAPPLPPCGACRQMLIEFTTELPILSVGRGGAQREYQLSDLLPEAFGWPGSNTT